MDIVCSICSRAKDHNPQLLPARERYTGTHIALVERVADSNRLPFFILSGMYGLVRETEEIPYYDYLLTENDVPTLAAQIGTQLTYTPVESITFFTKRKPSWEPYLNALRLACQKAGVQLSVSYLSDDD